MELQHSEFYALRKKQRSYQKRFQPGGLAVLTTNKKINILKVRFAAGRIRIIEEPQLMGNRSCAS